MARIARWIAGDILAERGVEKTPASMSALLPAAYVVAAGVVKALEEFTTEMADDLAAGTAIIRIPVFAGAGLDDEDLAAWEAELFSDDPPEGD